LDYNPVQRGKDGGLKMVYAGSGESIRRGEVLIVIPDLIKFLAIKQCHSGNGHKIGNSVVC